MSSKASRIPGEKDRLRKHSLNLKQLEALIRLRDTARPVLPTKFSGGSPAGSTGGGTGNFLSTTGGTMTGNIAFEPKVIAVSDGRVNLDPGGNPPDNSSYILVTGQGTPDDIKFIDGAERNGQYLLYQGTNQQVQNIINANILALTNIVGDGVTTVTVTLSDTGTLQNGDSINVLGTDNFNLNNAIISNLVVDASFTYERVDGASTTPESSGVIQDGNILTADGSTLVLDGTLSTLNVPIVPLIFDVTVPGGGIWRVVGSPKFPSSATLRLQADQASDGVVAFDDNNIVGAGIVDEGNGIFRLRDVAYTIETHLRIMTTTASGGGLSFQWEQADDLAFTVNVSNIGTEGFVFSVNENDSSSSQPFCSAEVDATLEDKFIRLVSTEDAFFEFIMASSSSTTIFSGGGGGGVADGGGGTSFPILYPKEDLTPAIAFNQTIDLSVNTGNAKQIQFPAGDIGLQIIGDPANTVGEDVYVMFIQDSVGGRSLSTVDSRIKNGSLMDTLLDKNANAKTTFRLSTLDGGVSYHAILVDLTTGTGDVVGPGSSTDEAIARFDGVTGKIIQNSGIIINDSDEITGVTLLTMSGNIDVDGNSIDNALALEIDDSVGATKLSISGPLGVGARFTFVPGDTVFFTENITDILSITATGLNLLTHDITMGTGGNIVSGGAGEGVTDIGHLDFVDNLATPGATFSIFSDGTDLFGNTGSHTTNFDNLPELTITNTFTAVNTFDENIIAGGAGDGVTNIGHLDFVDNLATPVATFSIFSDGTDLFANTGSSTKNLDEMVTTSDTNVFTAINTFNENIIGGGAGDGMTNVGHFDFVDNLATPVAALSIFSDGTDLFVNTGGGVVNLSNVGDGVFLDSTFRIQGSGDQTKQLAFEVDGITTSTTRTITVQDADGILNLDGTTNTWSGINTFTGIAVNLNSGLINLGDQATDLINVPGRINTAFLPNGAQNIGSLAENWNSVFATNFLVDDTIRGMKASGLNLEIEITDGNDILFTEAGTSFFRCDGGLNSINFDRDVVLGNSIADTVNFTGRVNSDIDPSIASSFSLGTVANNWSNVVANNFLLDNSVRGMKVNGSDVEIETTSGNDILFTENSVEFFRCDGGTNTVIFERDIELNAEIIRAASTIEIGFFVTNFSGFAGSLGSVQIPVTNSAPGTASTADSLFGAASGCLGVQDTGSGSLFLFVRQLNGNWAAVTLARDTLV